MNTSTHDARFSSDTRQVERASVDELKAARDEYACDDIAIDDDAAVSRTETGAWVQAWVYVEVEP